MMPWLGRQSDDGKGESICGDVMHCVTGAHDPSGWSVWEITRYLSHQIPSYQHVIRIFEEFIQVLSALSFGMLSCRQEVSWFKTKGNPHQDNKRSCPNKSRPCQMSHPTVKEKRRSLLRLIQSADSVEHGLAVRF